jgi:hypothetical protein
MKDVSKRSILRSCVTSSTTAPSLRPAPKNGRSGSSGKPSTLFRDVLEAFQKDRNVGVAARLPILDGPMVRPDVRNPQAHLRSFFRGVGLLEHHSSVLGLY